MTEVLFYHLEQSPLERVLPELLEKCLQRDWRAVVQAGSEERVEALDASLWTYAEDSFLPHSSEGDVNPEDQPVLLTITEENKNAAQVRFFVDGAAIGDISDYVRAIYMFDGRDPEALAQAREQWKLIKDTEHETTYWAQNENGRWEKKG